MYSRTNSTSHLVQEKILLVGLRIQGSDNFWNSKNSQTGILLGKVY